jgi:hypothetical protein
VKSRRAVNSTVYGLSRWLLKIKESDWKLFRRLRQVALERFCARVLTELRSAVADTDDRYHERYLRFLI